ncbi:MAG: type I DNA topoisomerase, partial [Clostridia bacterium]|nr:type I DNA topoisomerase [Clostridia bacterium]
MANYLVIVESPAKAKTIKKYLGANYTVEASMGHIRDLPKSQLGIDTENNFEPKYITIRGKGDLMSKLKKQAKAAKKVFLATDPDREGEAISWHLASVLDIDKKNTYRIAFNEITKTAVQNAVKNPREIDANLVDAQQARRVLDRIVGYKISPLLWKKVKKGLSAGRVQSVATRLIVDREREIEKFIPKEYWTIDSDFTKENGKNKFHAKFFGDKKGKIELTNGGQVEEIVKKLDGADYVVTDIKKSTKTRNPAPPFITSTMQQEANRKLGFTSKRTMQAAQQLYEGVNVGGIGLVGLITYMRTDSLRISVEAGVAASKFIKETYGEQYAPKSIRTYKTKKNAQDAHEAIRPSDVTITPEKIKDSVTPDLYRLYKLIWERFVASQMENAVYDTENVDITANGYVFKAYGSKIKFAGFTKVYVESVDEKEEKVTKLPELEVGEKVLPVSLNESQKFTEPPSRYTEATLIKTMEEEGIGRPSTYTPTISTILARGYVARKGKILHPTELGTVVTDLMVQHFNDIVDIDFTANMEKRLDDVETGAVDWVKIISDFYGPFMDTLKLAEKEIGNIEIKDEVSDVPCDKCGRMMVYKMGRFGKFLACPGFPECRNAKPIVKETGATCPKCGGKILVKKSKKGKEYYGCENNPRCDFMTWDKPLDKKCEKCGSIMFQKNFRGRKKQYCSNEE